MKTKRKFCPRCCEEKPASVFYDHPNTIDRLDYICMPCRSAYAKEWNAKRKAKRVAASEATA